MESHHVSRHFLERAGRMTCYRRYPKWTMVAHHESYLLFGMHLRYGPCQDSPSFVPAVTQAARHLPIDRLFADGAYDVEAHHRYSREQLGIRSTIIPINPRRPHQHEPKTKYRAQLHRRFPRRLYGSRWHVEAAISQHKRKLGSALSATSEPGRESECILRHIVHNLMILLLSTRKGFYRAFIEQWHGDICRVYRPGHRPFNATIHTIPTDLKSLKMYLRCLT